jgi:hypothetical protein
VAVEPEVEAVEAVDGATEAGLVLEEAGGVVVGEGLVSGGLEAAAGASAATTAGLADLPPRPRTGIGNGLKSNRGIEKAGDGLIARWMRENG